MTLCSIIILQRCFVHLYENYIWYLLSQVVFVSREHLIKLACGEGDEDFYLFLCNSLVSR
jgi:hypothetical protein